MPESAENTNKPPLFVAILPMIILVAMLSFNVLVYRNNSLRGSKQMILLIAAATTVGIAVCYGHRWEKLLESMVNGLLITTPSFLILLMVGALAGTWLIDRIVPTIIYCGIKIINPTVECHLIKAYRSNGGLNRVRIFGTFPGRDARDRASRDGFMACPENFHSVQAGLHAYLSAIHPTVFLPVGCITSALVALATGSSWSTSATVGIALIAFFCLISPLMTILYASFNIKIARVERKDEERGVAAAV